MNNSGKSLSTERHEKNEVPHAPSCYFLFISIVKCVVLGEYICTTIINKDIAITYQTNKYNKQDLLAPANKTDVVCVVVQHEDQVKMVSAYQNTKSSNGA